MALNPNRLHGAGAVADASAPLAPQSTHPDVLPARVWHNLSAPSNGLEDRSPWGDANAPTRELDETTANTHSHSAESRRNMLASTDPTGPRSSIVAGISLKNETTRRECSCHRILWLGYGYLCMARLPWSIQQCCSWPSIKAMALAWGGRSFSTSLPPAGWCRLELSLVRYLSWRTSIRRFSVLGLAEFHGRV